MGISDKDIKLLWGRAANRCSAPGCEENLTPYIAKSRRDIVLGEMAHVIPRRLRGPRGDGAAGDDGYKNRILLCPNHHRLVDKAPDDYPAALLHQWKRDWEEEVTRRLMQRVSITGGDGLEMRLWTYFNFDLILRLYQSRCPDGLALGPLPDLQADGIVNRDGFPLSGDNARETPWTVFDTWPQDKAYELQRFYSGIVEQMIHEGPPIDLDEVWGIRKLRGLLYPTALGFINRACIFKTIPDGGEDEHRSVRCRAKGVGISFQINTWNVYSNSSLNLHFRGYSRIAALLLIRSIERPPEKGRVKFIIKATPLALGTGFASSHDRTPDIAWKRWESDDEFD